MTRKIYEDALVSVIVDFDQDRLVKESVEAAKRAIINSVQEVVKDLRCETHNCFAVVSLDPVTSDVLINNCCSNFNDEVATTIRKTFVSDDISEG